MKKGILFIILTFSFQLVFAQKEEWTKHFEKVKEATASDDDFYATPEASKISTIIAKYNEALDLISQVESKSSDYKHSANYEKAWIYKQIAYLYEEIENYTLQKEYVNKAFAVWPSYYAIDISEARRHIKFSNEDPLDKTYTELIYLGVNAAYNLYDYERVTQLNKLYEPVKKGISSTNEWIIYFDVALSFEESGDPFLDAIFALTDEKEEDNELATYYVRALEAWIPVSSEAKALNAEPYKTMTTVFNGLTITENDLKLRVAKALVNVNEYAAANKWYSSYAKSAGSPSLNVGWDYSESAMKEPDKTDARNSVNIIEQHTAGFSEYEWERLQKVYEFIGDNAKVQEIKSRIIEARRKAEEERRLQAQRDEEERKRREKEERKRDARGRFSLAVSTNPFMYIWNDYPIALDIRIGRVINEFRVNLASTRPGKSDKYHFGQYKADGAAKDFGYKFSGMEYSYTLKILAGKMETKSVGRRNQIAGGYVGFQPRYSTYDFDMENVTFTNSTTSLTESHIVSASATRYDFCILAGFLGDNLGGFFHIDYYFGVGVGYRKLDISSTDATFNYSSYSFDNNGDRRYDPERWNKIYVPVRFGFRIGINLL
jgi:hypothetical protein